MSNNSDNQSTPGFGKAAGIVAGVGIAGAGAAVAAGAEMLSQLDMARDEAMTTLSQHNQTLAEEGATRIMAAGDEHAARLDGLASDLEARYAASLEQHATGLEQRIAQNMEQLSQHMGEQISTIIHGGERELHRLAQQLESEIVEQRDRAIAEIREAGQRAVDLAQSQVDSIRSEAHRVASVANAEIEDKINNLESKVSGAIDTIHQTADARVAELHDFQGSFRVDQGANPEDDYQIG